MLGGTGNVTVNASDVTTGGYRDGSRVTLWFDGSDFSNTVVPLIRDNFLGVDGEGGTP